MTPWWPSPTARANRPHPSGHDGEPTRARLPATRQATVGRHDDRHRHKRVRPLITATLAVDIGGTFTDALVATSTGTVRRAKVLSTPDDPVRGFLAATRAVLRAADIAPSTVQRVVHASTLATNVIVERAGAPIALVTTDGYRTLLALGRDGRVESERYDLMGPVPEPIVPLDCTFTVRERISAQGTVLVPLDERDLDAVAEQISALPVHAVAVCLLNSFVNDAHEQRVAQVLRSRLPSGVAVTMSSSVLPEMREFDRMTTTVIDAYVAPIMSRYLQALRAELGELGIDAPIHVMDSAGGVMPAALAARMPVQTVESGPAAGVVAAATIAADCAIGDVIAFDMGGTTAKAAVVRSGRIAVSHDFVVGGRGSFGGRRAGSGIPLKLPVVDLAEVGSGGGSIAWLDAAQALRVGPRSAGASPGPACYGGGGLEPTVSDADLVLGYLSAARFAGATMGLHPDAATAAIGSRIAGPLGLSVEQAALAIHEIANADMAAAIHVVTVQRGIDPRSFALVVTGGAAPMHACQIAARFDIATVVVAPYAGVGSCIGLLRTDLATERSRTRIAHLDDVDAAEIEALLVELATEAAGALDVRPESTHVQRTVAARFVGQAHELDVALEAGPLTAAGLRDLDARFRVQYRQAFGLEATLPVQLVSYRVRVSVAVPDPFVGSQIARGAQLASSTRAVLFPGFSVPIDTPVSTRAALSADSDIVGPHLIDDDDTTVVIPPGWRAVVAGNGAIIIRRAETETAP